MYEPVDLFCRTLQEYSVVGILSVPERRGDVKDAGDFAELRLIIQIYNVEEVSKDGTEKIRGERAPVPQALSEL